MFLSKISKIVALLCNILLFTSLIHAYECNSYTPDTQFIALNLNSGVASASSAPQNFLQSAQRFIQNHVHVSAAPYYPQPNADGSNNQEIYAYQQLVPAYANYSAHNFAQLFEHLLLHNKTTEQKILERYELYCHSEFLKYIQTLPGYENHILSLNREMGHCSKCKKSVTQTMGYSKKDVFTFLATNAQAILNNRQDKAQQEAKLKRHAEAQRIKKQAQLKKQAQQRQAALEQYAHFNILEQCTNALETSINCYSVAESIESLSEKVFANADIYNYTVLPEIKIHTRDRIHIMKTTENPYELVFNAAMTDQILYDIQHQTVTHTGGTPTVFNRSSALFARAAQKFIARLNPITQATNMIGTIIDTARFASTITIGTLYLSEAAYAERIKGYWSAFEALSPDNLATLSAEQWVDLGAELAADLFFGMGVAKTALYLKEINAVAKTQQKASQAAKQLRQAVSNAMERRPIVKTANGIPLQLSSEATKTTKIAAFHFSGGAATAGAATVTVVSGSQILHTSEDVAIYIASKTEEILEHVTKQLESLTKSGNKIKNVTSKTFNIKHIFSGNHIKKQLLKTGESAEVTLLSTKHISTQIIKKIQHAHSSNLLMTGPNNINTHINNIPVQIRAFIKNDTLISINTFMGTSARQVENLITI